MSNIDVKFAYLNRKKYTPGDRPRLNLSISETVGKDDNKSYINYEVTLWDKEAKYYGEILADDKKYAVSFSGYVTGISANLSEKDNKTIYTSIRVNLNKSGNVSAFYILPDLRDNNNSKINKDDF